MLAALLLLRFHLGIPLAWVSAASLTTFLAFGYDKAISGTRRTRVPENVLLALVLVGGTPGALTAMPLFHHKTSKASFQYRFWAVVFLQALVAGSYFFWYR